MARKREPKANAVRRPPTRICRSRPGGVTVARDRGAAAAAPEPETQGDRDGHDDA